MEIRELTIKDFDNVMELERNTFSLESWEEEDWKYILLNRNTNIALGVFEKNKIIAFILTTTWYCVDKQVNISNLAVDNKYRSKGIGDKLFQFNLEILKRNNISSIIAETRISNEIMQKIFKKYGFSVDKIIKDYYKNPVEDALHYELRV